MSIENEPQQKAPGEFGKRRRPEFEKLSAKFGDRNDEVRDSAEKAFKEMEKSARLDAGTLKVAEAVADYDAARREGVSLKGKLAGRVFEVLKATPSDPRLVKNRLEHEISREGIELEAKGFMVLHEKQVKLADPKARVEIKKFFGEVVAEYAQCKTKTDCDVIIERFRQKNGITGKNKQEVAKVVAILAQQKGKTTIMSKLVNNPKSLQILIQQSFITSDPEQALYSAVMASSEAKKEYEAYVELWSQEQFQDVVGQEMSANAGGDLATSSPATPEEAAAFVDFIRQSGVEVHLGENNFGEIHFGEHSRDIVVCRVDGETSIFIKDRDADRGVRGPLSPQAVPLELGNIVLDAYFSEKFRMAQREGTSDPTSVADAKLFHFIHELLPNLEQSGVFRLSGKEKKLLANLAGLFAGPDEDRKFALMADKVRFFERVMANPAASHFARELLQTKTFTMSEFRQALREKLPVEDSRQFG